jgi:hypothetical protein
MAIRRNRKRSLDLFRGHPLIDSIFGLQSARATFLKFAERIENGEKSVLEGYGSDWFRAAAADAEERLVLLASRVRVDGEPLLLKGIL